MSGALQLGGHAPGFPPASLTVPSQSPLPAPSQHVLLVTDLGSRLSPQLFSLHTLSPGHPLTSLQPPYR